MAYPQKLVIVRTGEKEAEKQFLGYEFSHARGREGIHAIQRGKTIEECTRLFDLHSFDNPQKASTYIYKAFQKDLNVPIDDTLKENVSRLDLLDMMTFDRADFEKIINTKIKKKHIPSKYTQIKVGNLLLPLSKKYTIVAKKDIQEVGKYPVITQDEDFISGYCDLAHPVDELPIIIFGDHTCRVKYMEHPFMRGGDGTKLLKINERISLPKYVYYVLQHLIIPQGYQRHYTILKDSKIPLPPLEIQQKIVDEIEKIEQYAHAMLQDMTRLQQEINAKVSDIVAPLLPLDSVCKDIFAGGDLPEGNWSKICTDEYTVPIYSNGIAEKSLYGYTNIKKVEEDALSISARGTIGFTAIRKAPFYPIVRLIIAIPNKTIISLKYLWLVSKSLTMPQAGKTIPQLTVPMVKKIKLPVPSLQEQQKVVAEIEKLEQQIEKAQSAITQSEQQKQAILDKYLK